MPPIEALPPPLTQRLPPALAAAAAHLPALALGALLLVAGIPASVAAAGVGSTAALVAWLWGLPAWWRLINLLFVPGLWLALQTDFNANWYLAGFVLLSVTSLGAVRTRVPLYLSSDKAVAALAGLIPPHATFMDLGCGLGGPLAGLATQIGRASCRERV